MTRLAQRDQIAPVMRATFTQRLLMMDFLSRNHHSALKAQLTKWMLQHVLITDPLPRPAVTLLCPGITSVFLILTIDFALMLRAVPSFRQVWTARICTRLLRFSRYLSSSPDITKALKDFSLKASLHFIIAIITISQAAYRILSHQLSSL